MDTATTDATTTAGAPGTERVDVMAHLQEIYPSALAVAGVVKDVLGEGIPELMSLRASIINGCAFCIDMHTREAVAAGETKERLFLVAAWREAGAYFTDRERAAFALTDEATRLGEHGVSDAVYAEAAAHFTERELAALVTGIALINFFNRIAVTTRRHPAVR